MEVAWYNRVVLSGLRTPTVVDGQWVATEDVLLPGAWPRAWTGHSERCTLPSVLAAAGVPKEKRDVLGRWGPDGSDTYVRTYKAAVRTLIQTFLAHAKSDSIFDAADEEDVLRAAAKRLRTFEYAEADLEQDMQTLVDTFKVVYRGFATRPDREAVLTLPEVLPEELKEGEDMESPSAQFILSYGRNRKFACLHTTAGCYYAVNLKFRDWEYLEAEHPDSACYDKVCRLCWSWRDKKSSTPDETAVDSKDEQEDGDTSSETSTTDSSA